jgi:hypothetical protein
MSIHGSISGGGYCWVWSGPSTLPCFSQGGCLCRAVAIEGSVSCVCMPSSDVVGALVFGVSVRVAMMCGVLFAAMLVSGVPAYTECIG